MEQKKLIKEKDKQIRLWLAPDLFVKIEEKRLKSGLIHLKTRDFLLETLETIFLKSEKIS